MGALIGLTLGLGLLLVWRSGARAPQHRPRTSPSMNQRIRDQLIQAGYVTIRPAQLYAVCAGCGLVVLVLVTGISRSPTISLAFAGFAAYTPISLVRYRRRQRTTELREVWPDVVDNLASAVRAGMALPEAMAQVGSRGPGQLRPAFRSFAEDYRATGKFTECLDRLKAHLADPVGDRVVESMRVAREVGGTDLGRLLRTLSQFLRDDLRTRAEIEARQGWTIAAARLALAAPWLVLAMLAFRPDTVAAYNTPIGVMILAGGASASFVAYRLMVRIAALPVEVRVLR
jgi:tight adherence protein B